MTTTTTSRLLVSNLILPKAIAGVTTPLIPHRQIQRHSDDEFAFDGNEVGVGGTLNKHCGSTYSLAAKCLERSSCGLMESCPKGEYCHIVSCLTDYDYDTDGIGINSNHTVVEDSLLSSRPMSSDNNMDTAAGRVRNTAFLSIITFVALVVLISALGFVVYGLFGGREVIMRRGGGRYGVLSTVDSDDDMELTEWNNQYLVRV